MLVRFICENFLSFHKETEFLNTAGSKSKNLMGHIHKKHSTHIPILKGTAIYGANASGKSNFLKAISFSKTIISSYKMNIEDHPLSSQQNKFNKSKETKFEYEFKIDDEIYNYGFVCNWDTILEEWLYKRSITATAKEIAIFKRENNDLIEEKKIKIIVTKDKGRNFFEYCKKSLGKGQLFLHKLKEDNVQYVDKIFEWFEKITLIRPEAQPNPFWFFSAVKYQDFTKDILMALDSNISGVEYKEKILEKPSDIKNTSFTEAQKIFDHLTKNNKDTFVSEKSIIFNDNNQIKQKEILIKRDKEYFTISEESDGIARILDLIPFLFNIKTNDKIYLIDEIERSLHPHIARTIIEMFYTYSKGNENQLIFVTHDCNLIDLELMRKDEIWFFERDKYTNSRITSLAEYKIRNDLVAEKSYLQGRFGAIPFIGNWKKLGLKNVKKKGK